MNEIPTLETKRPLLRSWREEDIGPYASTCADPQTMRYMRSGVMTCEQTAAQIQMLSRHWAEHGHGLWVIEDKAAGRFVGRAGLMYREDWPAGPDKVEVGWLVDRALWNRGIAAEAAQVGISWGFEELGEERIISIILPGNLASMRVAEKCGLSCQGKAYWKGAEWNWYSVGRD